jgi:uncharacterized protein YjbI with pentapeptide repeats
LLDSKDGDWQGFVFPKGFSFPNLIDFQISATDCIFDDLNLASVRFTEPIDLSSSVFYHSVTFRAVKFEDCVVFDRCRFKGPTDFLNVECHKSASFVGADFSARTVLRVAFQGSANLNQVIFREGVNFTGWRNITVTCESAINFSVGLSAFILDGHQPWHLRVRQKAQSLSRWFLSECARRKRQALELVKATKRRCHSFLRQFAKSDPSTMSFRVFEDEGQLQDVVFLKPDQTTFSLVDLSRVYFRGTNLRGVRFIGVNWWQPRLNRNGLYDELFIRYSKDGPFRYQYLPALEETCRNARVALEDNRSFNTASDFYVAEMEAARAQLGLLARNIFSVNALYRFSSLYGTNVGIAIRVLFLFFLLHLVGSIQLTYRDAHDLSIEVVSGSALRSLQVLVQQNLDTRLSPDVTTPQLWLDAIFRVVGLVQAAMVALAFRSRIKRH